ncbi:glycosyltransferase family 2 protein [Frigidibacter sp. MR17.24]|uniref:glycosyltransferase family 2 protein n=1 Tax=Frigidibacter sp. MR17.24 TaxID=3127345 RepID=UPI003012F4F3
MPHQPDHRLDPRTGPGARGSRAFWRGPVLYIISLSSIPSRFADLPRVLAALLAQHRPPAEVRLYLPRRYRRFPDYDGALPDVPKGVEVIRVPDDLGPATKALYAARDLRGQAVDLLYCDDDRIYTPGWAGLLLADRAAHPGAALCLQGFHLRHIGLPAVTQPAPRMRRGRGRRDPAYRLQRAWQALRWGGAGRVPPALRARPRSFARSGFADIAEGLSGVAIRPDFLDDAAFDIPPVLWAVDDVWLSGQMMRAGHPVWLHATRSRFSIDLPSQRGPEALHRQVIEAADRDAANRACVAHLQRAYGIWRAG